MSTFHRRFISVFALASLPLIAASITARTAPAAESRSEKQARRDCFGDPLPDEALYRIGSARFRLGSPVTFLAFSKDGKTLLSVNGAKIARWDAATGKQLREVVLNWTCGEVALSPDGTMLAMYSLLVDAATGRVVRRFDMPQRGVNPALGIAYQPDGRTLATADDKGTIHLWDPTSGKSLGELKGQDSNCRVLAFSPDGKFLASAHDDSAIRLRSGMGWRDLRLLRSAFASTLAFSPDGKILAAHDGREIRLWNTATGRSLPAIRRDGHSRSALAFSPDGKIIACDNDYGVVCLWDVSTSKEIRKLGRRIDLNCLAFSPDGAWLAAGEENIRLYRVATGEEVRPAGDGTLDIDEVAFSPDGRLLTTSESDGTIRLWDADTGAPVGRFKGRPEGNSFVGFSADGKSLFTRQVNRVEERFHQWDLISGKEQRCISAPPDALCMALSSSGRILAWASKDGTIHLRDMGTGAELRSWRTKGKTWSDLPYHRRLRFSSQDKLLGMGALFGEQGEVREVKTGAECSFAKTGHKYLAFSSDGRIAAYLVPKKQTDSGIFGRQWRGPDDEQLIGFQDTATGDRLARTDLSALLKLSLSDWVYPQDTLFSPDGRTFVTAIKRQPVRFWETATGKERYRLPSEQSGNVEQLAFSPDGNKLATTGTAKIVLVWRVFGPIPGQRSSELSAAEQHALWADLANDDGQIAFRAIRALTASPHSAVELLRREVSPVPHLDSQRLARWIAELDADDFIVREKSAVELRKRGLAVEEALRRALRNRPTLEARRRIERLLADLQKQRTAADTVRKGRALEVLEHLSTPEAGRLLEELARGEPAARLTREAKASLERLRHRPAKP